MMQITRRSVCVGIFGGFATAVAQSQSDADVRKMLAERVDALAAHEESIGIIVGIVGPQGRRVVSYGHRSHADPGPLNGNTCFEIGSVTKVFTALLLADMVEKSEVALGDPVAKYLSPGVKLPERNGRPVTLVDLATHTSGLPFMPDELPAGGLYQFLARYQLPRDSGAKWDYSNIGYWLLSEALASRAGMDYASLLRTRIIAPLKLTRTAFTPSPRMKANRAVGHNAALQPSPPFSMMPMYRDMSAAGGLVSTTNDLLTFLAAAMGYQPSPLAAAMRMMLTTSRPIVGPGQTQALGWMVIGQGDDQLIAHDSARWGYVSSVAWDPGKRVGVVVLSNQVVGVDDLARHLLRPNFPLAKVASTKHPEVAVDSAVLDTYAGRYQAPAREHSQSCRSATPSPSSCRQTGGSRNFTSIPEVCEIFSRPSFPFGSQFRRTVPDG